MTYPAEAAIARELMKFVANGTLYRGSKPVMWSVVEKTALAEAEIEYEDYTSDQVWVKFPIISPAHGAAGRGLRRDLDHNAMDAAGNRAICFSSASRMALQGHRCGRATTGRRSAIKSVLADTLAAEVFKQARVIAYQTAADVTGDMLDSGWTALIR